MPDAPVSLQRDHHPPLDGRAEVDADVIVIGAGQAGLAAAYHLRRVGLVPAGSPAAHAGAATFVVLDDAPAAGGAWQHRWPSLTMEHVHGVHELPGAELPAAGPDDRASSVIGAYFTGYEQTYDLRVRRPGG